MYMYFVQLHNKNNWSNVIKVLKLSTKAKRNWASTAIRIYTTWFYLCHNSPEVLELSDVCDVECRQIGCHTLRLIVTNQRTSDFIIIEKRAFKIQCLYSLYIKSCITIEYLCPCILHVNKGYTRDKPFLFPQFFIF